MSEYNLGDLDKLVYGEQRKIIKRHNENLPDSEVRTLRESEDLYNRMSKVCPSRFPPRDSEGVMEEVNDYVEELLAVDSPEKMISLLEKKVTTLVEALGDKTTPELARKAVAADIVSGVGEYYIVDEILNHVKDKKPIRTAVVRWVNTVFPSYDGSNIKI